MEPFVSALAGSNINVEFAEVEESITLPPSCRPQLPGNWAYDDVEKVWVDGD